MKTASNMQHVKRELESVYVNQVTVEMEQHVMASFYLMISCEGIIHMTGA